MGEAQVSRTYSYKTGCGKIYVIIAADDEGKPERCFINLGKAGRCTACHTSALSLMIRNSLRAGVDPGQIARDLTGLACDKPGPGAPADRVLSCVDAVGRAFKAFLSDQAHCEKQDQEANDAN